jgi:hypothetical protein
MHPGMVSGLALDSPSDVDGYSNSIAATLVAPTTKNLHTRNGNGVRHCESTSRCGEHGDSRNAVVRMRAAGPPRRWGTERPEGRSSLCDLFGGLTHDFGERGGELGDHPLS